MGLILCDSLNPQHPYYIEELDIHIYSIEELSYIIYEHPLLVIEDFVSPGLFSFIKNELKLGSLGMQLEKMYSDKVSDEHIILYILDYVDFYTGAEVSRYRATLANYKKLRRAEFLKEKADYMFRQRRFGKAIRYYEIISKSHFDRGINEKFLGKVYHNMGSAYANLFLYDKAYQAYRRAYRYLGDRNIIKKIYYLSLMDEVIEQKEKYQADIRDSIGEEWDEEYEKEKETAGQCEKIAEIRGIISKDLLRRHKYITELIAQWKKEYRNML